MNRWTGYVLLVLAVAFLASIPTIRSCERQNIVDPKFRAALYLGHLDAVDSETKKHIDFEVVWDYEARSPFIKGSAPSVVETLTDGSKVITIVGVFSEVPFGISVRATGYHSKAFDLTTMRGGILTQSQDQIMEILELKRIAKAEQ